MSPLFSNFLNERLCLFAFHRFVQKCPAHPVSCILCDQVLYIRCNITGGDIRDLICSLHEDSKTVILRHQEFGKEQIMFDFFGNIEAFMVFPDSNG